MKKIIKKTKKPVTEEIVIKKFNVKNIPRPVFYGIGAVLIIGALMALYAKYGIVATVNGKPISRISYLAKLEAADKNYLLDQIIQEKLIADEAKKTNASVDEKEIDDAIAKIEEQLKAQGTTLEDALKAENLKIEDVKKQIEKQKLIEKMANPKIEITDAKIKEFLDQNKNYLPKDKSKEELNELAKQQLESQAKNEAVESWLQSLQENAKIVYRK